jgi:hypothetical protein
VLLAREGSCELPQSATHHFMSAFLLLHASDPAVCSTLRPPHPPATRRRRGAAGALARPCSSPTDAPLESNIHTFVIKGNVFEVYNRYTNLAAVGSGAYGLVCAAEDKVTGKKVAIKKVSDTFSDLIDAKRILREMKLLKHFHKQPHENIIGIIGASLVLLVFVAVGGGGGVGGA